METAVEKLGAVASWLVCACGALVLVGWYSGISELTTVAPGYVPMKPNTALALLVLAVSVLNVKRRSGVVLGGCAGLLGAATLFEFVLGTSFGIDQLLPGIDLAGQDPRMAPATATALTLLGGGVVVGGLGRLTAMRSMAMAALGVAYVAVLGYAYGVSSLYTVGGYTSIALHTAVCFSVLGLALLLEEPSRGLVGLLRDEGSAGSLLRPLAPALFIGPPVLGGLCLRAEAVGWFDTVFGVAILVMSMTVLGGALTWRVALRLRDLDIQRNAARQALLESNRDLERAVAERTSQLHATALRLDTLIQLAPVGIVQFDTAGHFLLSNERWTALSGLSQEAAQGEGWTSALHDEDAPRVLSDWYARVAAVEPCAATMRLVSPGGEVSWVSFRTEPMREDGVVTGHLGTLTDITALRSAQEAAAIANARFRSAFSSSPLGVAITSFDGTIMEANRQFGLLVELPTADLEGASIDDLLGTVGDASDIDWLSRLREGTLTSHRMERQLRSGTSTPVWVEVSVAVITDGEIEDGLLYELEDVTARRQAEERIAHLALHDPLTDLPNRLLLLDRLQKSLQQADRQGRGVGVLFIDLDGFKVVNDSLGHHAGDAVLSEVARRLSSVARASDTVARIGGDEFVVICPDISSSGDVAGVADAIGLAVGKPISIDDQTALVTASIGIAFGVGHDDPELLLRDADQAMYLAKEHGRARHEVFDGHLRRRVQHRLDTEIALRGAVERGEIETWYQPIVDLDLQTMVATEALVRWRRPGRQLVLPDAFIRVAEEVGVIKELGAAVLHQACDAAAHGSAAVSVNVSAAQFVRADFGAVVETALGASGLPPERLWLELTETGIVQAIDSAARTFQRLRRQGVRIAIDDFGTGYSSLEHLRNFSVDLLKIDVDYLRQIEDSRHDRAIVEGILRLADSLELDVVAEGIETVSQYHLLRDMGCRFGQGYFFGKPSPGIVPVVSFAASEEAAR
ncbi:MAG: EAL domain-containing protein [Propionibacteriales bacterium]|nr:EAL domain-containing protein [Propionibacteriales bacterium]